MSKKVTCQLPCQVVRDFTFFKEDHPELFKNEAIESVAQLTCCRGFVGDPVLKVNGVVICKFFDQSTETCQATLKFGLAVPDKSEAYHVKKAFVISEKRELALKRQLIDASGFTNECQKVIESIINSKTSLKGALTQYVKLISVRCNYEATQIYNFVDAEAPFIMATWCKVNEKPVPKQLSDKLGLNTKPVIEPPKIEKQKSEEPKKEFDPYDLSHLLPTDDDLDIKIGVDDDEVEEPETQIEEEQEVDNIEVGPTSVQSTISSGDSAFDKKANDVENFLNSLLPSDDDLKVDI